MVRKRIRTQVILPIYRAVYGKNVFLCRLVYFTWLLTLSKSERLSWLIYWQETCAVALANGEESTLWPMERKVRSGD